MFGASLCNHGPAMPSYVVIDRGPGHPGTLKARSHHQDQPGRAGIIPGSRCGAPARPTDDAALMRPRSPIELLTWPPSAMVAGSVPGAVQVRVRWRVVDLCASGFQPPTCE